MSSSAVALGGDHLTDSEDGGAGDVIEVPVAEDDREAPHALAFEKLADVAGVLDRDVCVS